MNSLKLLAIDNILRNQPRQLSSVIDRQPHLVAELMNHYRETQQYVQLQRLLEWIPHDHVFLGTYINNILLPPNSNLDELRSRVEREVNHRLGREALDNRAGAFRASRTLMELQIDLWENLLRHMSLTQAVFYMRLFMFRIGSRIINRDDWGDRHSEFYGTDSINERMTVITFAAQMHLRNDRRYVDPPRPPPGSLPPAQSWEMDGGFILNNPYTYESAGRVLFQDGERAYDDFLMEARQFRWQHDNQRRRYRY